MTAPRTAALRYALEEILADPDHEQCRNYGSVAEADCIIEGLRERALAIEAEAREGLDVAALARAILAARITVWTHEDAALPWAAAIAAAYGGQPRSDALREALEDMVETSRHVLDNGPRLLLNLPERVVEQARAALRESEEGTA